MIFYNYEEYKQFILDSWEKGWGDTLLVHNLTKDLRSEDYFDGEGTRMLTESEFDRNIKNNRYEYEF